jgi:hypothetical protein
MQSFRDALEHCEVYDLGFSGLPWTFDNKQKGNKNVKVRLDRVVALNSWKDWFKDAHLTHMVSSRSDRPPILLELSPNIEHGRARHITRYEIMWEREELLPDEIKHAWETGIQARDLGDVAGKLRGVMSALKAWSREKFGAITSELEKLRRKLEELHEKDPKEVDEDMEKLHDRMDELLYREEMMWLQRSRISWLKEGDMNTKFFHQRAAGHAKNNRIKSLKTPDGRVTRDKKEMETMTTDFFKQLYKAYPTVRPVHITSLFQPMISQEMNNELCKEFIQEEISNVMFKLGH